MKYKILYCDEMFNRYYLERIDEKTARHTSFIWSYELKKMVPYDTYTFDYTQYSDTWEEYVDNMLKVRENLKTK